MKLQVRLVLLPVLVNGAKVNSPGSSTSDLLARTINALGGLQALNDIKGLTLQSSDYRSTTLSQSYSLDSSDQLIATGATSTISFDFSDTLITQRIDRNLTYDYFWAHAHRDGKLDYSLVVQTGSNGSACFNVGGSVDDPSVPFGYADSYLTDYLVHSAQQSALLGVLKQFEASSSQLVYSVTSIAASGVDYPTLSLPNANLALLVHNDTGLPYAIRSTETHEIYGASTNDVVFSNYASVSLGKSQTFKYPNRIQTIYNEVYVLEDYTISQISANPQFPDGYFKALPPTPPAGSPPDNVAQLPRTDNEYPRSEVHEFYETGLWFGPFGQQNNVSSVVAKPVFPGGNVPQIVNLYVGTVPDYVQLLVEFEDGLVITDAAPHRSKIILQWVKENYPGKSITHVVPSHHHRDHAGGVGDYLAAGAKLVIPEIAKDYYKNVNGGKFQTITYDDEHPFIKQDKNVQFLSFWKNENPHASDWTWAAAAPACSKFNNSEVVVIDADIVNPRPGPVMRWDTPHAMPFFVDAVHRGIPLEATLVGAHGGTGIGIGTTDSLINLVNIAGFTYPNSTGTKGWC
ncbi:hypothetical protein HDV62DRAFT_404146 [Trichoderma sp. SZMC 28011]